MTKSQGWIIIGTWIGAVVLAVSADGWFLFSYIVLTWYIIHGFNTGRIGVAASVLEKKKNPLFFWFCTIGFIVAFAFEIGLYLYYYIL